MRRRGIGPLALAALLALVPAQRGQAEARLLGSYVWNESWAGFGGFSAIELDAEGSGFVALSDRALLVEGRLIRDGAQIVGVEVTGRAPLLDRDGAPLSEARADSEGLARAPDGTLYISFEGVARVRRQQGLDGRPGLLPTAQGFAGLIPNSGLEALAIAPDGSLWTLPERSGRPDRPFQVLRFDGQDWHTAFEIARRGPFLPVGADFGPDGQFYLLERDFTGIGFRNRIRRFAPDGSGETQILQTTTGQHDNLEGISVWQDAQGLRVTLISDDNFRFFQRTEIVEYRLD